MHSVNPTSLTGRNGICANAYGVSGTQCSLPFFIRSGGIVHKLPAISSLVILAASPYRAAVTIRNLNMRAESD